MDQLSLAELCHSKLGPLHPEPGEVFTCKSETESPHDYSPKRYRGQKQSPRRTAERRVGGGGCITAD